MFRLVTIVFVFRRSWQTQLWTENWHSPRYGPAHYRYDYTVLTTLTCLHLSLWQSDQDEDLKTQVNMILVVFWRRSLLVPLSVLSLLCPKETLGSPEEVQKPQSTISALRRSFLEGGGGGECLTEWDKRLAASPVRRVDDSPMIEPLEPDEVGQHWTHETVDWYH